MPIIGLAERAAKEPWEWRRRRPKPKRSQAQVRDAVAGDLAAAYAERQTSRRAAACSTPPRPRSHALFEADPGKAPASPTIVFKELEQDIVRGAIIKGEPRIDGRDTKHGAADLMPKSACCRAPTVRRCSPAAKPRRWWSPRSAPGRTSRSSTRSKANTVRNFMLHYNFPPYATGEAGRMGTPGRREIGHGKLAWRAVRPLLPSKESFPYTVRVVSEITESNGSSSMATVCGSSLSLMDAGVPLEATGRGHRHGPDQGGLAASPCCPIFSATRIISATWISRWPAPSKGITALQMDIKITSITEEIMKVALAQAREGRIHILGEMAKALTRSREAVSDNAPRITTFTIPKDKIREVIGSGGKVIREITEVTGAKVDIEDDGTIKVAAVDATAAQAAIDWIKGIVAEPEVGVIYSGKVVKTVDFGAFVNFLGARDGLVHISELAPQRVGKVQTSSRSATRSRSRSWASMIAARSSCR